MQRLPELLAPAGSVSSGLAAFAAGADAVYTGLGDFSARARADNLTIEQLSGLTQYARKHDKRVYLALNTLVAQTELDELFRILESVNDIHPDAVIVQDLGVLQILRTCFPELAIHASTQMGVHNSAGITALSKLGVERVILERQLPLDEIRSIIDASDIETEVFVHGALCCSISGSCLFSSWLGGWSGNRGRCKQPCRRRYFSDSGNGFFFSTNDLATLDIVHDLCEAGVASLKIEGRLRDASYVTHVVTAYRMMLDAPRDERAATLKRARAELAASLGRRWSHGFLEKTSPTDVVDAARHGVSGQLCGAVGDTRPNGFTVNASRPIAVGDRIRVQPASGDEGPAIEITRLGQAGRDVQRVRSGQRGFVYCDKEVPRAGRVFKTGSAAPHDTRSTPLPDFARSLALAVRVDAAGVEVTVPALSARWSHPLSIPAATSRSLQHDAVAGEFRKAAADGYTVHGVEASVEGNLFLAQRELRHARQAFWEWAVDTLPERFTQAVRERASHYEALRASALRHRQAVAETVVVGPDDEKPATDTIRADWIDHVNDLTDEVVLPPFCPESGLADLCSRIKALYASGFQRFRVTSLYQLPLLDEYPDVMLTAGFPLPVCNSMAFHCLAEHRIRKATAWVELDRGGLVALADVCGAALEVYRFGRPFLLATRAQLDVEGSIKDARGGEFNIERYGAFTYLYPGEPMELPEIAGCSAVMDLTHASPGETAGSSFNYEHHWG